HHAARDAQAPAARLGRDPRRDRADRSPRRHRRRRGRVCRVRRVLPVVAPRRRDARGRRRHPGRAGPGHLGQPDLGAGVGDGGRERADRRRADRRHRRGRPEPRRVRPDRVPRGDPRRPRVGARDDRRPRDHRPGQPVRRRPVARRVAGRAIHRARRDPPRAPLRPVRPAADRARVMSTRGERVRMVLCIAAIGAIGLNILVGFTGQISLGQGGFLAVGAFTSALLAGRAGLPLPLAVAGAVVVTATAGAIVGLPALRLKGLYLAMATLAAQEIIEFTIRRWHWLTAGQGYLETPPLSVLGWHVQRTSFERTWYWVILAIATVGAVAARNVFRTALGRSFMAVRDQDVAAQAIGVNLTRAKLSAFALSSGYVGLAGALTAHYTEIVTWERFTLDVSVQYLGMIIVGGLGSIAGSIYGAAFLMLVPPLLSALADAIRDTAPFLADQLPALQNAAVGVVIVLFLLFEPRGLDRLWRRVKEYVATWPRS